MDSALTSTESGVAPSARAQGAQLALADLTVSPSPTRGAST